MATDVYGRGVSWPFRLGPAGVAQSTGVHRVEESMRIILGTQQGERAMRPTFGSKLMSLVFAPNNSATANLAGVYVEDSLARWEPRIELVEVSVGNDNRVAQLNITITYRLRTTSELRTFDYVFPLERPR